MTIGAAGFLSTPSGASDGPLPLFPTFIVLTAPGNPTYPDGRLATETILELEQRSATFRDVVATIIRAQRVKVMLFTSTDVRQVKGLIGQTRFVVSPASLRSFVTIYVDRLDALRRRLAVAHELSHVVEAACLGEVTSEAALWDAMRQYAGRAAPNGSHIAFETAFAEASGRTIVAESLGARRGGSQFEALARQYRLPSCPPLAVSAQPSLRAVP